MSDMSETKHFRKFTEVAQQLVVYSGVLTALAYLFGRSYYKGYFGALKIDSSFIQLSIFDLVEKGWSYLWGVGFAILLIIVYVFLFLAVYNLFTPVVDEYVKNHKRFVFISFLLIWLTGVGFLIKDALYVFLSSLSLYGWIILGVLILGIGVLIFVFRAKIRKSFSDWANKVRSTPELIDKIDKLFKVSSDTLTFTGLSIVFLFLVLLYSLQAEKAGSAAGDLYLKEKVSYVELVTSAQISPNSCSVSNVYVQTDWQFLYFNSGRYFLTKLDSNSQPLDSLVVDGANVISMKTLHTTPTFICPPAKP